MGEVGDRRLCGGWEDEYHDPVVEMVDVEDMLLVDSVDLCPQLGRDVFGSGSRKALGARVWLGRRPVFSPALGVSRTAVGGEYSTWLANAARSSKVSEKPLTVDIDADGRDMARVGASVFGHDTGVGAWKMLLSAQHRTRGDIYRTLTVAKKADWVIVQGNEGTRDGRVGVSKSNRSMECNCPLFCLVRCLSGHHLGCMRA